MALTLLNDRSDFFARTSARKAHAHGRRKSKEGYVLAGVVLGPRTGHFAGKLDLAASRR